MKYYNISDSTGKETGRAYPQLHCLTQEYAHSMSPWEFPGFTPKLHFELVKTAKLTDVLSQASISASGLLVNNKVREILSQFKLMRHKFYEASIILPKTRETLNYYWLHLCQPELTLYLDYDKSIFCETEWTFRKEVIELNSYEHYKELKSKDIQAKFGVKVDEIFVTEKFDKDLDIFTFLPFSKPKIVSSTIKDAFDKNKVTGVEYEEAREIKF
ncbi:MAG: hypothetical protein KA713_09770 [Chryseotalea sp. WA131a]|nr:MAG: hypothetical protein KA713_09770 [Chryseotalea sp. WA131a]